MVVHTFTTLPGQADASGLQNYPAVSLADTELGLVDGHVLCPSRGGCRLPLHRRWPRQVAALTV